MKFSFAKKLTLSYLFVVVVTLFFTGLYLNPRLKYSFQNQLEKSLASQATLMAHTVAPLLEHSNSALLAAWVGERAQLLGCRITLINPAGIVLEDSERTPEQLKTMDNHAARPEIQAAVNAGYGKSVRHSVTLNEDMLYVAFPVVSNKDGTTLIGILRVALPLTEVRSRVAGFQKDFLKTGLFGIGLALIVALISVRRVIRPLEDLMNRVRQMTATIGEGAADPDEFHQLAGTIDGLTTQIAGKVSELSREKSQLEAILTALLEGVIAVDHRSRILFLNPAAERLFGVQGKDIEGRRFVEALRHSMLTDVLSESLNQRKLITREISVHTPLERLLRVHARPVDYGDGASGVLAALYDVSEIRRLERVRQEFVANVSHELKTPLTSIKGFVETLLDGALDDPLHNRDFLETIQEQTHRLMRLIDDILDLSAIEARRVTYRFETVPVRDVIERLFNALEPQAKTQNIRLIMTLPADLPPARADREKLAQILLNLIDNAIKFNTPNGQVSVQANRLEDRTEISVSDTGPGIPADDLPRVFERFYRGDKSHSQTVPGTGLGLSIVKHLVEAHGGTVVVESQLGQGATFRFTLPH